MNKYKVLVAIPVFNEIDVIDIIRRVKKFSLDVLVIDDGSNNSLKEKLVDIERIHLITHSENIGYGKAIIDAFTFAINNGYDYLITMDGDGQHEPEEIPLFLNGIPLYDCDILSGSRYLLTSGLNKEIPKERYRINREITGFVNRITGFNLTDAFCGFKTYKVEKLKMLHLTEYGYGMPLQLWLQAWKIGLRVHETPVKLIYKDVTKQFSGILKDPVTRLRYYRNIIEEEFAHSEQNAGKTWDIKKKVKQ